MFVTLSQSAVITANILKVTCDASSICNTWKKPQIKASIKPAMYVMRPYGYMYNTIDSKLTPTLKT